MQSRDHYRDVTAQKLFVVFYLAGGAFTPLLKAIITGLYTVPQEKGQIHEIRIQVKHKTWEWLGLKWI